ncbi:MAG: phycobilisome protein [Cyanothece sp. SIO1E1]|nr:phycobilisome protein [Cyanothece sp. SIO1E1]
MLSQLDRLSLEADGRYATVEELQCFKEYFRSFKLRLIVYQKIQVAEEKIVRQVENRIRARDPDLFRKPSHDITAVCRRDIKIVLRNTATTLLSNDLDHLRDCLLLWHQTIICSFKIQHVSAMIYQEIQAVLKQYLTPQENALLCPILELNSSLLC